MDFKQLATKVAYRIEVKPDGGFLARAVDPSVPPLEAATREELQAKINAEALAKLAAEIPALQAVLDQQKETGSMDGKAAAAAMLHALQTHSHLMAHASEEQIDAVAGKLGTVLEKNFPGATGALPAGQESIKVTTRVVVKSKFGAQTMESEASSLAAAQDNGLNPTFNPGPNPHAENYGMVNTPIAPEAAPRWPLFLLALLLVAAVLYFYFR